MTENNGQKFYGKYRGTVTNNVDPMFRGRLLVQVPDVLGLAPSSWAEPCVPLAGPSGPAMGVYLVPPIGAGVWIDADANLRVGVVFEERRVGHRFEAQLVAGV